MKKAGELGYERLFLGSENEIPQLTMNDRSGKERVRLFIDSTNVAKLHFYDENGRLIDEFPNSK